MMVEHALDLVFSMPAALKEDGMNDHPRRPNAG
jgi:hypothetical protein